MKLKAQRAPNGARDEKIRKKKSDSYWGAVADSSEFFSPVLHCLTATLESLYNNLKAKN